MENIFSILNFEEGGTVHEINSPRSLEACLRAGLDPNDLLPRHKESFKAKDLTSDMVDIKFQSFEKKRKDKISIVKAEREAIIEYGERMQNLAGQSSHAKTASPLIDPEKLTSAMIEMEQKRLEAVRRRQEKELSKIIAREQAMVDLQVKIKHAEDEELKKKKEHEKRVAELKNQAEKKKAQRLQELARKEQEDIEKRKLMTRKEAAFERKMKAAEIALQKQYAEEAKLRDIERQKKMEEHRKKTEAILEQQFEIAEQNRLKMAEREANVKAQLEQKKEMKKEEILTRREQATKRIKEALEKHHALHDEKKIKFISSQTEAFQRAKELEMKEREALKKQAEDRERKNRQRFNRLSEAARLRSEYRSDIMNRLNEKDQQYEKVRKEREEAMKRRQFMQELKNQEARDNVERVSRINEFSRLQTLRRIQCEDERTERLLLTKIELQRRHREESKHSLVRKHAISNAMDIMRVTNDFSMLDQLFSGKRGRRRANRADDGEGDDPRLAQTA